MFSSLDDTNTLIDKKIEWNIDNSYILYLEKVNLPYCILSSFPKKDQNGPYCGYNAISIVTDYWHSQDSNNFTCPVKKKAVIPKAEKSYRFFGKSINPYINGIFDFAIIKSIVNQNNYEATIETFANFDEFLTQVKANLHSGKPIILAVDRNSGSSKATTLSQGKNAHHVIIFGYIEEAEQTCCLLTSDGENYYVSAYKLFISSQNLDKYPSNKLQESFKKPNFDRQKFDKDVDLTKLRNHLISIYPKSYAPSLMTSSEKKSTHTDSSISFQTQILMAVGCEHQFIIKKLLADKNISLTEWMTYLNGQPFPLHLASAWGHLEAVEFILENHENIDLLERDNAMTTPWYFAAKNGHTAVLEKLVRRFTANNNLFGGEEALEAAATQGNLEMVKILLEQGSVSANTTSQYEPLLYTVARFGHVDIIKLLIEKGADETLPFEYAAKLDNLIAEDSKALCLLLDHIELKKLKDETISALQQKASEFNDLQEKLQLPEEKRPSKKIKIK